MRIFLQKRFWLRAAGVGIGVINFLGSLMAWETGGRAEPARYLVAAIVLFLSGIFWLMYSLHPKLDINQTNYKLMLTVLVLGMILGLFHSYNIFGGECEGASYHHQYYGYPGRWLTNSRCTAISSTAWWDGNWSMDHYSLIADLFFWSGAGLLLSLLWSRFKSKPTTVNS